MQDLIHLTDAAIAHIQQKLAEEPNGVGFRLSLKKTGCSGFAYVPAIVDHIKPGDMHYLAGGTLPVYVDPACLDFVRGMVIDYKSDESSLGLKQKRLTFENPQEKNRCGCGESFTTE